MITPLKKLGDEGEKLAIDYLKKQRYKILTQHYQKPTGEIDIIAQDKDKTIVFFEVKTRTSISFGPPQEAVDTWKQRKLIRCAQWYLLENKKMDFPWRIDVLTIDLTGHQKIEHFKNAVEEI